MWNFNSKAEFDFFFSMFTNSDPKIQVSEFLEKDSGSFGETEM